MTDQDKKEFAEGLTMVALVFGQPLEKSLLTAYWQALNDLPLADFNRAVAGATKTLKWFPKPAELRDLAGQGTKANALIAWDAVRGAMRKHGYTHSVDFGPLVNAVIRSMGGWIALDDMETAQLDVWGKKEFERVYDLLAAKDVASLNGGALAGAFGGVPVRIAIGGSTPVRQIASSEQNGVSDHVRKLADSKAVES